MLRIPTTGKTGPDAGTAANVAVNYVIERDFLQTVRECYAAKGWLIYHTYDSRRSNFGFPDLVMIKDFNVIIAEIKTEKGRLTEVQANWLDHLEHALGRYVGIKVCLWRPRDWPEIERLAEVPWLEK